MKNQKGFTLVELLAVIVLLALIAGIAIPSALTISKKVKEKTYSTKIDLIESAADNYAISNISLVRKGTDPNSSSTHYTCKFDYSGDTITSITFGTRSYSETESLGDKTYRCIRLTVEDLVNSKNLDYDETNQCSSCSVNNKSYYDNIVIDSSNNYIINKCYVYLYYKNNRTYTYFDKTTCDSKTNKPTAGHEYHPSYCLNNSC